MLTNFSLASAFSIPGSRDLDRVLQARNDPNCAEGLADERYDVRTYIFPSSSGSSSSFQTFTPFSLADRCIVSPPPSRGFIMSCLNLIHRLCPRLCNYQRLYSHSRRGLSAFLRRRLPRRPWNFDHEVSQLCGHLLRLSADVLNSACATFALNLSSVWLIGKASGLVLTLAGVL